MLETFAGLQCEDIRDKVYGLLSLVRSSGLIPVDYSKTSADVFFNAIQRIVRDESFMEINSHFNVGQHLRDRMMLDISDTEIFDFINKELWEIKGQMALWLTATNGHVGKVKLLLDQGAELETKDESGRTSLSRAANRGHKAVVKLLLDQGAKLETKDESGRTPLSHAAERGYEAVVKLLLDYGADVKAADWNKEMPLWYAFERGHEAVVKPLLDQGAELETKDAIT